MIGWDIRQCLLQTGFTHYQSTIQTVCYFVLLTCSTNLFVGIHQDVAFDTFLTHVGPRITAHPFPFTFCTFVFTKTSFLSLVRSQSLSFGPSLQICLNIKLYIHMYKGLKNSKRCVKFAKQIHICIYLQQLRVGRPSFSLPLFNLIFQIFC